MLGVAFLLDLPGAVPWLPRVAQRSFQEKSPVLDLMVIGLWVNTPYPGDP